MTSPESHRVDLAAFTDFSQEFGPIIIHPVNFWAAVEHLYNRAAFCCGKFLNYTSDSLSRVKDLNLTPGNATLKASRNVFCTLDILRCSNNINAQIRFASKLLNGNALTSSSHKDTSPPLIAICQINKTNDLILNLTPENMTQHSRIE